MGSGPKHVTSTTFPVLPSWLEQPAEQIVGSLTNALFPGGNLLQYNPALNQQVAPFSPLQTMAQEQVKALSGDVGSGLRSAFNADKTLADPNLLYADRNPYLSSQLNAANQATVNSYQFGTAPSEMSNAVMAGTFGGTPDAVQRLQNQFGLSTALANADTNIAYQNYLNQQETMLNAAQLMPGLAQGQYIPSQMLSQAGSEQQQQQQNMFNAGTSNAWQALNFPFQMLQTGTGILAPYFSAFTGQKTTQPNTQSK